MYDIAIQAARGGGAILMQYFQKTGLEREIKDDKSFVTAADTESEEEIVSVIRAAYPDHDIVGEESGELGNASAYQWVIDPLDGTTNFVNGIPLFAVSIAVLKDGVPVVGVVYNPATDAMYSAEKGSGLRWNDKPAQVSDQEANMGTITFGAKTQRALLNELFVRSNEFFKSKRNLGSTALELAYVARGGTEGFVCVGLSKWDYAAGVLLVEEAGGAITGWDGGEWNMGQNYFIASNGVCHDELAALVQSVQ